MYFVFKINIILVVNASTCMLVHVEAYKRRLKENFWGKYSEHKHDFVNKRGNYLSSSEYEIINLKTLSKKLVLSLLYLV